MYMQPTAGCKPLCRSSDDNPRLSNDDYEMLPTTTTPSIYAVSLHLSRTPTHKTAMRSHSSGTKQSTTYGVPTRSYHQKKTHSFVQLDTPCMLYNHMPGLREEAARK